MTTPTLRILVVDDHEPFRRFVLLTLDRKPDLQVVGEAADGLEAMQKAEVLLPDLMVLDLALPKLNGLEVARQIGKVSPDCKILFVSQESSSDVVQEALRLGALGYVVKTHAASDLLDAVEAVRQGKRFFSNGL
jgi:DNA-binding NarL/FixJ family response regulator